MSSSSTDGVREQKKKLRKEMRPLIKTLSVATISEQSDQVWERLFALDAYKSAKSVGLFLSMPKGEIKTDPALTHTLASGKTVYIPQVGQNFEQSEMDLLRVFVDGDVGKSDDKPFHHDWPRNKWDIPEPPPDMPREVAKPGDIDVLVVPGLAFDSAGARLGHGKGYYDRFIARMRQSSVETSSDASSKPLLVGVAMEPQIVESIPFSDHDFHMDMLLTPSQTRTFYRP